MKKLRFSTKLQPTHYLCLKPSKLKHTFKISTTDKNSRIRDRRGWYQTEQARSGTLRDGGLEGFNETSRRWYSVPLGVC